ncbi:uncharacterized protein [Branchiostoma lanceolatum]|uniref:uncharacterized protein isoform X1 n=1 Tax=Branchiostoma lanceolatum TaxID=7740 RepID=UPI0034527E18
MARPVAVIGAGAAGLCAARHLSARPDQFVPTVYEQTDRVGGTWVYTDRVGTDEHGLPVHSSMYKNLRTNLPKEVMAFPDFPFDSSLPSFVTHQQVLQYLEDYTDHFQLRKHIQFLTKVDTVKPVTGTDPTLWEVTVSRVGEPEKTTTQQFDAVMVCNGHFSEPYIPEITQASLFEGISLHSHEYRSPEPFVGMDVVILGAGSSGLDIALDVSRVARRVVLSHDRPMVVSELPTNLIQSPGIKSFRSRTVEFKNGEELDADAVIYCTGYNYSFPFLTPECRVFAERGRVSPLFKHIVHTTHTTLSFIGVCARICPCPQFHLQVQFAMAVLDRSLVLPPKEDMDKEVERDYTGRLESGMAPHHAHVLGNKQWEYHVDLARLAGCQPLSKALHSLHVGVLSDRATNLCEYRKSNYSITGPETWCKESVAIGLD